MKTSYKWGMKESLMGFCQKRLQATLPDKPMFMAKLKHFVTSFKDLKL
jgi:hypothetical protein